MNLRRPATLAVTLAALLAATLPASAEDNLYNPYPDRCHHVTIAISNNPNAAVKPNLPTEIVRKGSDGLYKFHLKVYVHSLQTGQTVTIKSIKLKCKDVGTTQKGAGQMTQNVSFDVEPKFTATSYDATTQVPPDKAKGTKKWCVEVTTESSTTNPPAEGTTNDPCVKDFTLDHGDCTSCSVGAGVTCTNSASSGCFTYDMPLGRSDGGDTDGSLRFYTPDMSFPGLEGISVFVPSSVTVTRTPNSVTNKLVEITFTTPTTIIVAAPTVNATDSITITHTLKNATQPFRTTTISKVTESGITWLRADSLFGGTTTRHQQKKAGDTYTIQSGSFTTGFTSLREVDLTITPDTQSGTEVHREIVRENGVPVSDIKTTWANFAWGWEKIEEIIDPDGYPLTSSWTYYMTDKGTGPPGTTDAGSDEGYGRIESYVRYDGYMETHYYWYNNHTTFLPFAGAQQGLKLSRQWNEDHTILTTTRTANGKTLSMQTECYNAGTNTVTTYTDGDTPLTTVTTLKPFGLDFGGQPSSILHPDGTLTTYGYERLSDGSKTVTMNTGAASGNTVSQGKSTTTTYNRYGTIIRQFTKTIGYSPEITLEHYAVTSVDDFGRPFTTAYFPDASSLSTDIHGSIIALATGPAWTTSTTYSCCGVESTTDRHGVTTTYEYDGLRRQIKSTTLGVTTETVHNGLTTTTKRNGLVVAESTRNRAGIETSSSSPDPSSDDDEDLVATTTATTYANGLTTTLTTVPGGAQQTTITYPDGRIWKTYGDLAPAVEHAYTVNTTGLISASGYTHGGTVKEITATQTDWAGRTVATGRLPMPTGIQTLRDLLSSGLLSSASYSYNSNGQLKAVIDADGVATLYGYNALGERTTTATALTAVDPANIRDIDFNTDRITRTETAPATRGEGNAATTVLRTTTRVWRDSDIDTVTGTVTTHSDGFLVSTTDRTPDGRESWSQNTNQPETHTSSATVTTIGLNFSDGSEDTLVSDAPADGFANWTDSWLVLEGNSVQHFFQNGTVASLVNGGPVRVSWQSSSTPPAAGTADNNEQALYHSYLGDSQTDPTNTDFGGTSSDGIGVRVTITGLADWLAAHGHTSYQIRAYCSSGSEDGTFQIITIHEGNATGTSLGTITPAVMGQADYPTGLGGSSAPRGYGDSPDSLTAGTITLTIPVGTTTPSIRGTLAAIKITGLGMATTPPTSPPAGSWTETTTHPDGTSATTAYSGGRPLTVTRHGYDNASLGTVTQGFDSLGRPAYTIDSRTGLTTTTCVSNTCDMVDSVTDPGSRTTSFTYDSRGNRLTTIHPDDSITHNRYNSKNQREATWGSLAYATVYSYDYAWRRLTLGTSPTITNNVPVNNTGIITYWQYSPDTGVLTGKFHDYREQGHARGANLTDGPTYTHTAAGRLQSRTWKRGVTTGYYYNQAGQLRAVNYSDATPDVLYTHDRLGRVTTAAQGTLNTGTMGLDPTLRFTTSDYNATEFTLDSESTSLGGGFPDKTLTRHTDTTGRLRSLQIDTEYTAAYGYDSAGRLKDVWDRPTLTTAGEPTGDPTFTYGYLNNSNGLVQTVTGPAHTVTNTWETTRDVLASKVNAIAGNNIPSSFAYGVNAIGQRTTVSPVMVNNQPVSTYTPKWAWDYNDQGELIEANDQAGSNDRAFQYDDIGNREKTVNGLLGNLPSAPVNYTANPLNQYTATPLAVASPVFDADGNLTEDREANKDSEDRQYVWDAENRLIAVNSVTRNAQGDITATTGLVTYQYDYMSRLITRTTTAGTTRFLYDGWNLIAEYTGTTLTKTYTWGMDLSGTMQGAGGVGGLLAVNDGTASYYPTFDGNGNVSEYLAVAIVNNVPVVSIVAHYEYDAFGNTVVWSGAKVADFSHRFSTKSLDQVTGWYYYGYRYYDPLTGRWPSRDPIEEEGGINLYGFVENSSINYIDYLGELTWIKEDANWVRQWGNQLRAQNQEGGIQWSDPGVDVLAYTVPRVKGKFKCKKDAAAAATGCWKLSDTTLTYNSEVVLHTDRWYRKEKVDPAWVVRAKNDHVADFDKWASQTGKPLAERTEKEKLKKGYPSKSDCEDVAAETFRVALQKSALIAVQATIAAHDTSKKHSWGDPNQRP